ncbi:hypothetical protein [Dyadobacter sp. NIV53]|uniref:hypothetical protein n=1 Tax=Dyadobacter sp. NIV53 TaxID=2861765 RepID=UPI001C86FDCB|nr:hypothetical protein [Dyadobacter sp. NIV53]
MIDKLIPTNQWLSVILVSGITGTAVMTLCIYVLNHVTKKVMNVTKILGTMITCETTDDGKLSDSKLSVIAGIAAHYAIGIMFAYGYHLLWSAGVGAPGIWNGLLLGFVSGIFAVIFWFTFFAIHPFPPHIELKSYLPTLFITHFVFASATVACYIFFSDKLLT